MKRRIVLGLGATLLVGGREAWFGDAAHPRPLRRSAVPPSRALRPLRSGRCLSNVLGWLGGRPSAVPVTDQAALECD